MLLSVITWVSARWIVLYYTSNTPLHAFMQVLVGLKDTIHLPSVEIQLFIQWGLCEKQALEYRTQNLAAKVLKILRRMTRDIFNSLKLHGMLLCVFKDFSFCIYKLPWKFSHWRYIVNFQCLVWYLIREKDIMMH